MLFFFLLGLLGSVSAARDDKSPTNGQSNSVELVYGASGLVDSSTDMHIARLHPPQAEDNVSHLYPMSEKLQSIKRISVESPVNILEIVGEKIAKGHVIESKGKFLNALDLVYLIHLPTQRKFTR